MASKPFDPHHTLVSSYLIPSSALAAVRLLIAVYVLAGLIFMLVWGGVKTKDIDTYALSRFIQPLLRSDKSVEFS